MNALSVWYVEDDKSNLDRVIAAFAASREYPDVFDYALFDYFVPSRIEVACEHCAGQTPDELANRSWHYNLKDLSGLRLVELARDILKDAQKERVLEKRVGELIRAAIYNGHIDPSRMKPKLADAFSKPRAL